MTRPAWMIALALASPAGAFELAFPVDCALGDTCFIQQYLDHDPGLAATDFTCGPLSYDGHTGTDIALESRAQMLTGVAILAGAPGTVVARRDGVADFAPFKAGQNCGNGVVIDHGGGWETQYCHLREGSVLPQTGDVVVAGTPLGMVGQSGQADFPHLHLSVRLNSADVDPFAPDATNECAKPDGQGLWKTDITYTAGGIIGVGVSASIPKYDAIKAGLPSPELPSNAPALVVWAYVFGGRAGDVLVLQITGPFSDIITERVVLEKTQAQLFRAVGKKLKTAAWPAGSYTGAVQMLRAGTLISAQTIELAVKN